MKTAKDYFEHFSQELSTLTDDEFISRFNREVGISASGIAPALPDVPQGIRKP